MSSSTQTSATTRGTKTTTRRAKTTAKAAKTTASAAKSTARSAGSTARSATSTARAATTRPRREVRATERGIATHGRRIAGAAQAEVSAVASQPTRPLFFALGLADRYIAGVRSVPSRVVQAPTRTRQRVVSVVATAGDLAERAQRGYTEVAVDGEKLVRAVRRQQSTQEAVKYAERAQLRGQRAVRDTEKAVDAGTEAVVEAAKKLG